LRSWGLVGFGSIGAADRILLRSSTPFSMILGAHEEGSDGQSRRRDESEAGRKEEKGEQSRGEEIGKQSRGKKKKRGEDGTGQDARREVSSSHLLLSSPFIQINQFLSKRSFRPSLSEQINYSIFEAR
jgi:cobalamin biosynthesis protein CobT